MSVNVWKECLETPSQEFVTYVGKIVVNVLKLLSMETVKPTVHYVLETYSSMKMVIVLHSVPLDLTQMPVHQLHVHHVNSHVKNVHPPPNVLTVKLMLDIYMEPNVLTHAQMATSKLKKQELVTHVTILAQLATDSLKTLVTLAQKEHT